MDVITEDTLYTFIKQYVEPELLVLIPALLFIGWMMKRTPAIPDWVIPYVNTVIAMAGGTLLASTIADGLVQGVLVSAMATLAYNLYQQWRKKSDSDT